MTVQVLEWENSCDKDLHRHSHNYLQQNWNLSVTILAFSIVGLPGSIAGVSGQVVLLQAGSVAKLTKRLMSLHPLVLKHVSYLKVSLEELFDPPDQIWRKLYKCIENHCLSCWRFDGAASRTRCWPLLLCEVLWSPCRQLLSNWLRHSANPLCYLQHTPGLQAVLPQYMKLMADLGTDIRRGSKVCDAKVTPAASVYDVKANQLVTDWSCSLSLILVASTLVAKWV